jgi:ABC-type polar amino acid transport system ATPase subunit
VIQDIKHLSGRRMVMAVEKVCIDLKNITKSYETPVLKDISLHITNGDYIAIVGMSGAGKSTLMNIIGLIEGYDSGTYEFDGELINNKLDYAKIRREKKEIFNICCICYSLFYDYTWCPFSDNLSNYRIGVYSFVQKERYKKTNAFICMYSNKLHLFYKFFSGK